MPVIKIFVNETHWGITQQHVSSVSREIQEILTDQLNAAPDKCQILFSKALIPETSPPIYVDFQYRANAERTEEIVNLAAEQIAKLLRTRIGAPCRTRAFAIDIDTLIAAEAP